MHDGSGALISSNDNWKDSQQTALEDAQLAPTDDRESAIEIALGPGLYTAIVRGAGDTTGGALVEPIPSRRAQPARLRSGSLTLIVFLARLPHLVRHGVCAIE